MTDLGLDGLIARSRVADGGDSFVSSVLHGVAGGGPIDPLEYITSRRIKEREIDRFRRIPLTANADWAAMLRAIPVVKSISRADVRAPQQVLIDTLRGTERLTGSWEAVKIFIANQQDDFIYALAAALFKTESKFNTVALLGSSGSGKTALADSVANLI